MAHSHKGYMLSKNTVSMQKNETIFYKDLPETTATVTNTTKIPAKKPTRNVVHAFC